MSDVLVIGTDTDAGKTTFSLLFLAAFGHDFAYWKPVETGDSDAAAVSRLVPSVQVQPPFARFTAPLAPPLAAAKEGRTCPTAAELLAAKPTGPLLVETFGGPFSPLNLDELQVALVRELNTPTILIGSTSIGAIGRMIAAIDALAGVGVVPSSVVLIGPQDPFACEQIVRHRPASPVHWLTPPVEFTTTGVAAAAHSQHETLAAIRRTFEPGFDLIARDRRSVWHPFTSLRPTAEPLSVVAAEGEFLHLADGRRLIDAVSSWWTILHGHRHPPLVQAIRRATDTLDHVIFAGVTHPDAVTVAELLLKTTPWPDGRVFFSDNGSTSAEVALKMAYQFWCHRGEPQRTLFVGFENGYHGDTFGAMAVGRDPLFTGTFEPLLFRAARVPVEPNRLDEFLTTNPGRVAAVILEPLLQAAGGMRTHQSETLRDIVAVCRRHGVLFIADEVMTGNRTGRRWAFDHAGVAPDLICASKTLTGGILPLGATIASPEIVAAFDTAERTKTLFHGHSFTANPLACAAAAVNERLVAEPSFHARVAGMGDFWRTALTTLAGRPNVAEVRILGSVAAVELKAPNGYLAAVGDRVRSLGVERGVLLRPLGNVVYALPPVNSSRESLQRIAEVICEAAALGVDDSAA